MAQFRSFADKMPVFYASIVACFLVLTAMLFESGITGPTIMLPPAVAAIASVRMMRWIRRRGQPCTEAQARLALRLSAGVILVSCLLFVLVCTFSLRQASEALRFFVLVQLFGCTMVTIYCTLHLRLVPYLLTVSLFVSLFFLVEPLPMAMRLGLSATILTLALCMLSASRGYYRDFMTMVDAATRARSLGEQNLALANLDMLTDLPNRRRFFHDLEALCREGSPVVVAIADLDGFKSINDAHGHVIGDKLLQRVAAHLTKEAGCEVYRLGGDEFALILAEEAGSADALIERAMAWIRIAARPVEVGDKVLCTGCSIGLAIFPEVARDPEQLYECADYALYHAKRSGGGRALLFTPEHERLIRRHSEVEQAFRRANLANEFYPVYQPIVDARKGRIVGFECLTRWHEPVLGDVSPGEFIPIVERAGLVSGLTLHMLRRALNDAKAWPAPVRLAFNLSAHDLSAAERAQDLVAIVRSSGFPCERLEFELTETSFVRDIVQAEQCIQVLKQAGIKVSLDDFGTGYSSLNQIHRLPLDKIKIDQGFVCSLRPDDSRRTIIGLIVALCRELDLTCVVEGVETAEQFEMLRQLDCEQMQGYLFSRPVRAKQAATLLAAARPLTPISSERPDQVQKASLAALVTG